MSTKYNNEEYRELVTEFLGEAFYLPGLSYGTKIQKIRQYTEIIIRRLLNYPCDKNIEIGNTFTKDNLTKCGYTEQLFVDALEIIRNGGNERTHTKWRHVAQEDEYEKILNALFDLYGYLFYKYFKKYEFGSDNDILTAFSILPPIIRHIALSELYKDSPFNTVVVEKLVLAKIKALGITEANEWVTIRREDLEKLPGPDLTDLTAKLAAIIGKDAASEEVKAMPKNMYEVCIEKIKTLGPQIEARGPLYTDFETAKNYYLSHGVVNGTSEAIREFNDLMDFVYMGRKKNELQISNINKEEYLINQIVIISPNLWDEMQ